MPAVDDADARRMRCAIAAELRQRAERRRRIEEVIGSITPSHVRWSDESMEGWDRLDATTHRINGRLPTLMVLAMAAFDAALVAQGASELAYLPSVAIPRPVDHNGGLLCVVSPPHPKRHHQAHGE